MNFFKRYDTVLILLVSLLVCTSFVWAYPIYILDEARNSEAAREMLISGDFIVPMFNGQLRTDKPPLHYFFMVLGYKIFGVGPLGARFFSGIFGGLTIWFTYFNVNVHKGFTMAVIVALILLSSLFFIQEFHLAVPDPYLICFVSFSLFCFYNFYTFKKRYWVVLFYVFIALGVLTKGPIALVLPGISVAVFLFFKKQFNLQTIISLRPVVGLLVILVIAGPWYYLVHQKTDGIWTQGFFLDHNISRFGSEKEGHGGLFIITPLFVLLGLLPFSVFSFQGFVHGWKNRKKDDFEFFSWIVAVVVILFFSVSSTKLPNYPMPCYPFIAVLIAAYFNRLYKEGIRPKSTLWSLSFLMIISLGLPIGGFVALGLEEELAPLRTVAFWLIIASITSIIALLYYFKTSMAKAFFTVFLGWTLLGFCLFGIIYPKLTAQSPVSVAENIFQEDSKVIVYKRFDSAFPINYRRTYAVFTSIEELKSHLALYPETFILTNTRSKEDLELLNEFQLVLEQKGLFENNTTRIYASKK